MNGFGKDKQPRQCNGIAPSKDKGMKGNDKRQVPLLDFEAYLIYPNEDIGASGFVSASDYFSRNNLKAKSKGGSINDNASTKLDSKSLGSKGFTRVLSSAYQSHNVKSPSLLSCRKDRNVVTRLYNYAFYMRNKRESQKRKEDEQILKRMQPKTNKSLIIEWDYPIISIKKTINNKPLLSSSNEDNLYQPSLNKHSLKIAKSLEPSCSRLTKKRKRYKPSDNSYQSRRLSSFELSYDYNKLSNASIANGRHFKRKPATTPPRIQTLYDTAMEQLKLRTINYEVKQRMKEEEYKLFPFRPTVSPCSLSPLKSTRTLTPKEMYLSQVTWKEKVERQKQAKRERRDKEDLAKCTFKPQIDPLGIENDEEIILRNINQMNEYIIKRRKEIEKKRENEEYARKRFFIDADYEIRTTQPKQFNFHQRNRKKACCRDLFRSNLKEKPKDIVDNRVIIKRDSPRLDQPVKEAFMLCN